MLAELGRNWWALALRGAVAILFGVAAIVVPGITLAFLVALFAVNAFLHGISYLALGLRGGVEHRWPFLISGIVAIIVAVMAFLWPGLTAVSLLLLIGAWAIVSGIAEILAAIRLRAVIDNEWPLALTGILSVLFGLYVIAFPGAGALTILWLIGAFAIVSGVLILLMAFRLRSHGQGGATAAT